jgi:DNA primase
MKENFSIIVEGYFDLLALHAHGIFNAVATLGTALTPDHVSLLKRFAKDVVVVFDPDEGGKKAAERSLHVFLEKEMTAKIVVLPDGNDPDAFMKRYGKKDFLLLVQKARPLIDFVVDECRRRHGTSIQEKARAVDELIPLVHSMKSPVEIDLFVRKISVDFGVREEAVRESLEEAGRFTLPALRGSGGGEISKG